MFCYLNHPNAVNPIPIVSSIPDNKPRRLTLLVCHCCVAFRTEMCNWSINYGRAASSPNQTDDIRHEKGCSPRQWPSKFCTFSPLITIVLCENGHMAWLVGVGIRRQYRLGKQGTFALVHVCKKVLAFVCYRLKFKTFPI